VSPTVAGVALACAVGGAVLAVAVFLIRNAGRLARIDLPDARRLHQAPTPRGGGLAMPFAISAAGAGWVSAFAPDRRDTLLLILGFALANGILGIVDDYRPLRSRVKFGIQGLLAMAFVTLGPRIEAIALPGPSALELGAASYPFTVLWLIWASNVYNFMDGMDGLAAGSGVAFFFTLALVGWLGPGDAASGWTSIFAAAACAGFLAVNYPPARIFMGDGGALFIGALLGGLAVALAMPREGAVPFPAAVFAMGSFMWDATYTIVMRMVRGEDWLHPHKRHLFQRLVTAGWTHSAVRRVYVVLGLAGAAAAVAMTIGGAVIGTCAGAIALGLFVAVSYLTEQAEKRASSK